MDRSRYDAPMALDGFIFDFDGTLIDSNALHALAWQRAFARYGYTVALDRIDVEIGKGGDNLVPAILGEHLNQKGGDTLRDAQPEEFQMLAKERGIRVFPGARELLEELRRRGIPTVLATSSGKKQLSVSEEASGFPVSKLVDEITNADDIETSKPAPDLVGAAVKRLKMTPAQCAMLGDTPWDAEACKHGGVVCLGVTCGGRPAADLYRAGARAVFRDPADVLARLDEAMHLASPAPLRFTANVLESLMREALAVARDALANGEAPIAALLARGDGTVLARGYNELNRTGDKTAHAEMVTFAHARGKVPPDAKDLTLVSTLEPCVMCLGASMEARVDTVLYALRAPADSGTGRVRPPQSPDTGMPRIVGDILAGESRSLFEEWINKPGNNPEQVKFVRQLLALTEAM
jgi:beta-phosphoglucomutase-like phosphatase (HAD superfamily)/tRNA(Arg) A34 adenosine deaminase TadA